LFRPRERAFKQFKCPRHQCVKIEWGDIPPLSSTFLHGVHTDVICYLYSCRRTYDCYLKTDRSTSSAVLTLFHVMVLGMRSTSPPEDGLHPRREVSVANTDLLFSLFRGIEEEQPKMTVVRRGRYGLSQPEFGNGSCVSVLVFTRKKGARSTRSFSTTWCIHEVHAAALLGAFPKLR